MKQLFLLLFPAFIIYYMPANIPPEALYRAPVHTTDAPGIELSNIQPVDDGNAVVYMTCSPKTAQGKTTALLSVSFKIKNKEAKTVYLNKIRYTCTGNGNNISKDYTGDNENKDTINAGKEYSWQNSRGYHELGDVISLTEPFPTSFVIKLYFDGFADPFTITKSLKGYINDIPGDAYAFPAKEVDLDCDEYWNGAATHGGGGQVFAYDFGVKGWDKDKKAWSSLKAGADASKKNNADYRCYGKPVYAMADGEVVSFIDNLNENPKAGEKLQETLDVDYGGNHILIRHGKELAKYSHFQKNKMNKNVMKAGAKVKKGDFLSLSGNSGNSTNPHLHIHCVLENTSGSDPFRPLQFRDIYVFEEKSLDEPDPNAAWIKVSKKGIPYDRVMIWPSAGKPCWYPAGWGEIGKHGIPEKDYQKEFDKITGCGYYPVWVDVYEVNGGLFFNAIFRYNKDGISIAARHDLTASGYQETYDNFVKKLGYRLLQVDSYVDNGKVKYACIFQKKADQPAQQPAYHNTSAESHQEQFEKLTGQGFVPVNVSVVSVGGKRSYTAFYEKRNVAGSMLKSALTQQEYQSLFEENAKKGMDQVYINAYKHDGETRFSVIWYANAFNGLVATRKSSGSDYQEKYDEYLGKGFLTRSVTGYEESDKHWFAALWGK
jgi:murein DD-endopeptidase MepM/ murein hydrolase activator NlpD